jgi:hypothetical protein
MAGPYRVAGDWTLLSEHRVSALWRGAFLGAGVLGLGVVAQVLRAMFFGPSADVARGAVGAWATLAFLVALDAFFLFVALRASEGRVALHREGVVLTDVLGRVAALAWTEVTHVGRLRSRDRGGERMVGWALHRRDETRMIIPAMYAGAGEALERLATSRHVRVIDERAE